MDWERIVSGLFAGTLASCYAFLNSLSILFGGPAIPKHTVLRAVAEVLIAFPISWIAGYAFADPLSHTLTSLCQVFAKGLVFDRAAAGVFIGFIGVHGLRAIINGFVKRAFEKKVS